MHKLKVDNKIEIETQLRRVVRGVEIELKKLDQMLLLHEKELEEDLHALLV